MSIREIKYKALLETCQDASTPPETLARLAKDLRARVFVEALCENPALPVKELLILGARAPASLLRNPVWPLLILAESSFLERMPLSTQGALAGCPSSPPDLIRRLAGTNRRPAAVRAVAAANSATPLDVLTSFLRAAASVRAALARNEKLPIAWHGRLAKDPSSAVRASLACRRDVSPALLMQLSRDRSLLKVRVSVAGNPKTPYPALYNLSRSTLSEIQRALQENRRWNGPLQLAGVAHPHDLGLSASGACARSSSATDA